MDESEKALLKNITILRLLPQETQSKLLDKFTKKRYRFGEIIVREGEPADIFLPPNCWQSEGAHDNG